jgi:hypothetical protein
VHDSKDLVDHMKWLNVTGKWRQSEKRPPSCVELEGMLKMAIIQDHMTELAIRLGRISEWAGLSPEESQRQEEQFRRAMGEKNALFKGPKEEAVEDARRKLGLYAEGCVQSYGDNDERRCLREIANSQKHIEKELHRMTREALRRANRVGSGTDRRSGGDNENCKKAWETYEVFRSAFEAVAGRKFMSG